MPVIGAHPGVIGVIGGMGSYVTLHLFERLLDAYRVEKEWERPRIIIDNHCTLPSRVRAVLYGEGRAELVEGMSASLRSLAGYKPDAVLLPCHTAHCFVGEAMALAAFEDGRLVDMVGLTARHLAERGVKAAYVLATEGTIAAKIYDDHARELGFRVEYPDENGQSRVRAFIELVKQRRGLGGSGFGEFLSSCGGDAVVLGCTELSVLFAAEKPAGGAGRVVDPIGLIVDEAVRLANGAGRAGGSGEMRGCPA